MPAPRNAPTSLLSALVQRPLVTAAIVLGCAGIGVLQPVLHQREPVAEAVVLLSEAPTDQGDVDSRAFVRSQAAVARLPLATNLTAAATDAVQPDAEVDAAVIERGLRVSLAPGETGLVFRMRHSDPDVATYAADAAAYSYQRLRRAHLRAEAAAAVRRLDALSGSLAVLPAGLARESAREALARQRAVALVQQVEPDLGVVAVVPAELESRHARAALSGAAGLLAGLVPALVVGHALRTRDLTLASPIRGTAERAAHRLDLGGRQPVPLDVVTEVLGDTARGAATVAVLWRGSSTVPAQLATTARQPPVLLVPLTRDRSAALASLQSADAAVAVLRRGRHELGDSAQLRELLHVADVPLVLELRLPGRVVTAARRWQERVLRRLRATHPPSPLGGVA